MPKTKPLAAQTVRAIYCTGGPANLISAHRHWREGVHEPTEVSVTFSSQIEQACQDHGCATLMISTRGGAERLEDGLFTIEHRPKRPASGWRFHLAEIAYGLRLVADARRFKASVAFIDSGASHLFVFSLLRLFGIRVVPILHNTLWPTGFFPTRRVHRLLLALDRWLFWKRAPAALVCVSPECERQVRRLQPDLPYLVYQVRAQFLRGYFDAIAPARYPHDGPFGVMFIGRVERMKGVFDILEMARWVNERAPGRVQWRICGRGPDLDELTRQREAMGLQDCVELLGWVGLDELQAVYERSHACIVPTRSIFTEALAMTAVEAVLAGRPLVSNPVVPATELLAPACLLGRTDDAASHAAAVLELATNEATYERLRAACKGLASEFIDPARSLERAVHDILQRSSTA
jgi:glycosyltransferase involved in cell wall biosynthesis